MVPRTPKLIFFFQAEDGIRDGHVTGVQTCALPILFHANSAASGDNATAYDNLNRETGFRRGTLTAVHNGTGKFDTVATSSETQSWTLDGAGNWKIGRASCRERVRGSADGEADEREE